MKLVDPVSYLKLASTGRLPSPQNLALAITRLLQNDDYKTDELVRLIKSDPALAGAVLKYSNAAIFANSRPNVSLPQAVITLGTRRVGAIVLALSVLHSNRDGRCLQFDYELFCSHSLATAISAQSLSSYAKINAEENFTAGLLCNVGELALASIFPERYGEIISVKDDNPFKRIVLEQEAFGVDHRELTASMLLEWGLPGMMVTAIYHCEDPDDADFPERSRIQDLMLSLHIAHALADICVSTENVGWEILTSMFAKAARLGISAEELSLMTDKIIASWLEWGDFLKIQTREVPSFVDLFLSSQGH